MLRSLLIMSNIGSETWRREIQIHEKMDRSKCKKFWMTMSNTVLGVGDRRSDVAVFPKSIFMMSEGLATNSNCSTCIL